MDRIKDLGPGLALVLITALAALFLSEHYTAPAMLFALLLGIAMSFLYEDTPCKNGIDFAAGHVLRWGIALLGLRIAWHDVIALGWQTALLLVFAIITTISLGVAMARLLKLRTDLGLLTGGSVAICGASAALAISAILPEHPNKERDTLATVVGVTAFSTLAMVLYPFIAGLLNLGSTDTGIFIGATIHDVAQVVGAGYSVSEPVGDIATLTKLVRVSLLVPVIMVILLLLNRRYRATSPVDFTGTTPAGVPVFLIAFILLMLLNSTFTLPSVISQGAAESSRLALLVAITAIGMKSNLKQLLTLGIKPLCLLAFETLWIALFMLAALLLS